MQRSLIVILLIIFFASYFHSGKVYAAGSPIDKPKTPVVEWTKSYDFPESTGIFDVIPTKDNGYAIYGTRNSSNDMISFYIQRLDTKGNKLWEKTLLTRISEDVNTNLFHIRETIDGGFIIPWNSEYYRYKIQSPDTNAYSNIMLLKLDKNGNTEWQKEYEGLEYDINAQKRQVAYEEFKNAWDSYKYQYREILFHNSTKVYDVIQTSDGNYLALGSVIGYRTDNNSGSFQDLYLLKVDSNGNKILDRTVDYPVDPSVNPNSNNVESPYRIINTNDGGFAILGTVALATDLGTHRSYVVKLNKSLDIEWQRYYIGNPSINEIDNILQTKDNGYILSGVVGLGGGTDNYILKLDSDGKVQWEKRFGTNGFDRILSDVFETDDNGYMLSTNTSYPSQKNEKYCLYKFDTNGNEKWKIEVNQIFDDWISVSHRQMKQTIDGGFITWVRGKLTKIRL